MRFRWQESCRRSQARKPQATPKLLTDAKGRITAGAEVKISAGKPTGSLSLGSEKLNIAGLSIAGLSALAASRATA